MAYPTSNAFKNAVARGAKSGATMVTTLEIREGGRPIATPEFQIRDGSVTADVTAQNWRRCDVTLADTTGALIPSQARDLFSPVSGRELVPRRGFRFPDGTVETVPLGVMKITSTHVVEDDKQVTIQVSGTDRSIFFSDNKWTQPWSPPGFGLGDYASVMLFILFDRALPWMANMTPALAVDVLATSGFSSTDPLTYNPGDDPWSSLQSIASSIGFYAGFNVNGSFIQLAIPDPALTGAFVYQPFDDVTHRFIRKADSDYSDQDAYNGVIAIGQNTFGLTPPRATVWDDNPSSATYYLGPNGAKPYNRPPDPLIRSNVQAQAAARGELNKRLGASQTVEIDTFVNPALDLLDVVSITLPRSKLAGSFMVERVVTPLTQDKSQQVRMRERRITG